MRLLRVFGGILLLAFPQTATADNLLDTFTFRDGAVVFAELRCTGNNVTIDAAWQVDPVMDEGPYKLHPPKLHAGGRLLFDYDSNVDPRDVPLEIRTADCNAGTRRVRARLSAIRVQWGGERDRDGTALIRLWIDERPLNVVLPVNGLKVQASIDLKKQMIHACAERTVGQEPNNLCADRSFELRAHDDVEFGPVSRLLGAQHDYLVVDGTGTQFCRQVASHLGGEPSPLITEPAQVPAPRSWGPNSVQGFRFDADNDGSIEDVVIFQLDQYLLTGALVATFEPDTVFAGKVPAPWWGDLMSIAVDNRGLKKKPAGPPPLKAVSDGLDWGILGDTWIKFFIVDGKSYAHARPLTLKFSYRPETIAANALLRAIEPARPEAAYREIFVRPLGDLMKAEPVCTFTRRSQIFE